MININIEDEIKDDNFEFLNDLHSLNKDELVGLIYDFWKLTKDEAEKQIKDTVNFRQEEYGRLKMTQVNRLKILLKHAIENK